MDELLNVKDVGITPTTSIKDSQHRIEDKLVAMFRAEGCAYDDILFYWIEQDNGKYTLTGYGVWND